MAEKEHTWKETDRACIRRLALESSNQLHLLMGKLLLLNKEGRVDEFLHFAKNLDNFFHHFWTSQDEAKIGVTKSGTFYTLEVDGNRVDVG
jgi:hypothetical protein